MSDTDILTVLVQWLREQSFTPPPRIVQTSSTAPPAAYPCLTVVQNDERFTNGGTDNAQSITIRVECASGRLGEAQAQARSLARQVRAALHKSHALGGSVRQLHTEGIDYAQREVPGAPVVALAELHVAALS
jgi:hypothetical protein